MQRLQLEKWAKAIDTACLKILTPILLGAALVTGCGDFEDGDDPEILDPIAPAQHEDSLDQSKPNVIVNIGPDDIAGHYIVQMKRDADPHAAAAAVRAQPTHVFEHALTGFAGPLDERQLIALENNPEVLRIEADQLVTTTAVQQVDGAGDPWGLDRIDERSLPLDKRYSYNVSGQGVYVYVLDTGIDLNHSEFDDVKAMFDAFGGNGRDCHGHGTHVAGIIGGNTWGVAKSARLRSVRVVGCNGTGTWAKLLAGVEWVKKNHAKPAVVNVSLSGPRSSSVNDALNNLANSGVFVSVSAGNHGRNACNYSPSSASKVFVAAASDRYDKRASFSNYGSCVSGYAPGMAIKSAWNGGGTRKLNGTSMAAPHVAGAAALYKSAFGDTSSSKIRSDLRSWATKGKIGGNISGTSNSLLYMGNL